MRHHLFLLAASSGVASARWLRWSGSEVSSGRIAVETGSHGQDEAVDGWTPKPTPAPEHGDLRKRQASSSPSSNIWLDGKTCGWYSGTSSAPFTCQQSFTCATNTENVVACTSGLVEQFFTVCFDLAASKQGQCASPGPQTGCCGKTDAPACGTMIWSGSPAKSMYQCVASATVVNMNDQPQFVIDASKSTSTTPTTTPGETPAFSLSSTSQTQTTTATPPPPETTGSPNPNLAIIIGSSVGGFLGLLLLLLLLLCSLRRRRNRNKNITKNATTKTRNKKTVNITHDVPLGRIQRAKDLPGSSSSNIPGLQGPYVTNTEGQEGQRGSPDGNHSDRSQGTPFAALLGFGRGRGRDRGNSPPRPSAPPRRPSRPDDEAEAYTAYRPYRPADIGHERHGSESSVRGGTLPPPPQPPQLLPSALPRTRTPSPPSPPRLGRFGTQPTQLQLSALPRTRTPSPPSPPRPGRFEFPRTPSPPESEMYPTATRHGRGASSGSGSSRIPSGDVRTGGERRKPGTAGVTMYF